jgi:subtilisin family serine protease
MSYKKTQRTLLLASLISAFVVGCGGGNSEDKPPALSEFDANEILGNKQEVNRLRYFKEIKADQARKDFNVTGDGVRVTIMGEMVDSSHPDIQSRIVKQYNTFSNKGKVNIGEGNEAYKIDLYGRGSGHGTHIAGTIAAECDGVGIQGVACGASLDVYDLGAYGNERMPVKGWGNTHEFEIFFSAFTAALKDVTQRKSSRILTGSFNVESPYIPFKSGSSLENKSITQLFNTIEDKNISSAKALSDQGVITFENASDISYLDRVFENNNKDPFIIYGTLLSQSKQWKALEDAVKAYQDTDGVYIITESNNLFENRTSILNAMPTISNKVDPDLWISAVLVNPKGYDEAKASDSFGEEVINELIEKGEYVTPINSCGEAAADYCILIPSYDVLSTMTDKVAEQDQQFVKLDNRGYQLFTGHSMGAPMIASALALMEELNVRENLGHSMKDLVKILKNSANRTFAGYDAKKHGRGLLDIAAALQNMR